MTGKARELARRVLPLPLRRLIAARKPGVPAASAGYQVVTGGAAAEDGAGWLDPDVAMRQHEAFKPLLDEMYAGRPRADFLALAAAVRLTGLADPLILEAGCGTGWNHAVLAHLSGRPVRYIGLDYSPAMVLAGSACYPRQRFLAGDAAALPVADRSVDILLSGTVLMHVLRYRDAVAESRRVARSWCIFHTVPVLQRRPTTVLRKEAYGRPVSEVILNEAELLGLFGENGLAVRHVLDSLPYDLSGVLGENTVTKTYVCEVA